MISIKPTVVGDVGGMGGALKGVPLSIFALEAGRLHTRVKGDCGSREIILGHMEELFSQATIFCRGDMNIAALWMPPSGFVSAMSMRLKNSGLAILPGGHMDRAGVLTPTVDPLDFLLGLRMSEFSIVFEDGQGVSRASGMTGVVSLSGMCRLLHAEGFRGHKTGMIDEEIEDLDAPARRIREAYA